MQIFILCAALIVYIHSVYSFNFTSDDSYITLRYARNLAEGQGLVFNPGDRVEGFTSPLWTLIMAGAHWGGLDILWVARLLGAAFGYVAILLATRLLVVVAGSSLPTWFMAFVPLALSMDGDFACWAGSGMETMLYVCLIVASYVAVLSGNLRGSAMAVMALIICRPEGSMIFLVLSAYQILQYRKIGMWKVVLWLLACGSAVLILHLGRYLYYGQWLPNTYYAKVDGGMASIKRGIEYMTSYAALREGLMLMVVPLMYGLFGKDGKLRILAMGVVGLWFGAIASGGDGLPMYRFALGPLPLLLVLQACLLGRIWAWILAPWPARRIMQALCVFVSLFVMKVHATTPETNPRYLLYDYQKRYELPRWIKVGKWLREHGRPGESVAAVPIGAVSFYSRLVAYDMVGLTDAHIAHSPAPGAEGGWTGHEKHDGQYILDRRPTYLLLGNIDVTSQPRDPLQYPFIPYPNQWIWNREHDLYKTTKIASMYDAQSVQLAPEQYLNFYVLRRDISQ